MDPASAYDAFSLPPTPTYTMAESNSSSQDSSQPPPKNNSRHENLFSDIKDVDAPRAQPSIDRFEIIRKSTPKSTVFSSLPHILRKIKTYRTDITIQSYMKNARRPPPPYILEDHLQADIDEVRIEANPIIAPACAELAHKGSWEGRFYHNRSCTCLLLGRGRHCYPSWTKPFQPLQLHCDRQCNTIYLQLRKVQQRCRCPWGVVSARCRTPKR